jgi:hypothetical protein
VQLGLPLDLGKSLFRKLIFLLEFPLNGLLLLQVLVGCLLASGHRDTLIIKISAHHRAGGRTS